MKTALGLVTAFVFLGFWGQVAWAQSYPIGLYEGFMGNSGVAASDPKAASYYNPSLLRERKQDSFSLSGTSFGSSKFNSDGTESSSLDFAPSYLSTVMVGEDLNHEFFFVNIFSGLLKFSGDLERGRFDGNLNSTQSLLGYSMAFRSLPLALQFAAHYTEANTLLFSYYQGATVSDNTTVIARSGYKNLGFSMGISTYVKWDSYTFGVRYLSRSLQLLEEEKNAGTAYVSSGSGYTITPVESGTSSNHRWGHVLTIGHGIRLKSHEFLFDTILQERAAQLGHYDLIQTFGYRLIASENHQFFAGLNHLISEEVHSFGDSLYMSTGYAWRRKKLLSSVGLYSNYSNIGSRYSIYGVNFSSEFEN